MESVRDCETNQARKRLRKAVLKQDEIEINMFE